MRQAQSERNAVGKKGGKAFDASSQRSNNTKASLTENFDKELYDDDSRVGYNTSIAVEDDQDMDVEGEDEGDGRLVGQYTATAAQMNEWAQGETAEDDILESREKKAQIASRETDYQKRRFRRELSPGHSEDRSYREVMAERELEREEERVRKAIEDKDKEKVANGEDDMDGVEHQATLKDGSGENGVNGTNGHVEEPKPRARKRRWRWHVSADKPDTNGETEINGHATNGKVASKKSRWDSTPALDGEPAPAKKRSKWDEAPSASGATPGPGAAGIATPVQPTAVTFGTDISTRNAALSDEELDEMLPSDGYKILEPPPGYEPLRAPAPTCRSTANTCEHRRFHDAGAR